MAECECDTDNFLYMLDNYI